MSFFFLNNTQYSRLFLQAVKKKNDWRLLHIIACLQLKEDCYITLQTNKSASKQTVNSCNNLLM